MDGSNSLSDFVVSASRQGQTVNQIKNELLSVGWDENTINTAIAPLLQIQPPAAVLAPESNKYISDPHLNQSSHSMHKKVSTKLVVSGLLFLLFASSVSVFYFINQKNNQEASILTEPTLTKSAQNSESGAGFTTFSNTEYKFFFHMPDTWSSKEFSKGAYGSEKRIAFGEINELPTEFFKHGNYAWIRIYPISDSNQYSEFQLLKSQIGQGTIKAGSLGGKDGVDTGTSIAVEKDKYVYEMNLIAEQDSNLNWQYTNISNEIIASFTFTP